MSYANIPDVKDFDINGINLLTGELIPYKHVLKLYLNRFFSTIGETPCWKLYVIIDYQLANSNEIKRLKYEPAVKISNDIQTTVFQKSQFDSSTVINMLINFLIKQMDSKMKDLYSGRNVNAFDVGFFPGEEIDNKTDRSFGNTIYSLSHK